MKAKKLIALVLLVILLLSTFACGGDAEEEASPTLGDTETPPVWDIYWIIPGYLGEKRLVELRTIGSWHGTDSAIIPITITQTPWVVNSGYEVTSSIGYQYEVYVCQGTHKISACEFTYNVSGPDVRTRLMHGTGDYFIQVDSSGVEWWVRVGVE